jgi:tRNA (adenine57-N1/adenine58-N1)-methyltransferase
MGIGHTTYLCFARKAFFDRESRQSSEEPTVSESDKKVSKVKKAITIKKSSKKTS